MENDTEFETEVALARELEAALVRVADQLDRWAEASQHHGWSTHQVEPMQSLAASIRRSLVLNAPQRILIK